MTNKNEARVEVYVPRALPGEDPNLYVSINGINFLLPKGKTSLVPEHVAREVARCAAACHAAQDNAAKLASA